MARNKLSLRKRRELAKKAEAKEFQHELTSNATEFITSFILPRLMASAQMVAPGVSKLPTMTIDKGDSGYYFQIGRYKNAMPIDTINADIIQEALSLAPAYQLIPAGNADTAYFSMPLELD